MEGIIVSDEEAFYIIFGLIVLMIVGAFFAFIAVIAMLVNLMDWHNDRKYNNTQNKFEGMWHE